MKKKIILLFFVCFNIFNPQLIQAEESGQAISYSVGAVLPDNQVSGVSYFDIEVDPGQEQELEVVINNSSDQPIQVKVTANTTVSNVHGVLTYDGSLEAITESDTPRFDELVTVVEEIVDVPANDQANAVILVKAPDETFAGRILGGLHFQLHEEETEESGVLNRFNYEIALNMVSNKNDEVIEPLIEFKEVAELDDLLGHRLEPNFTNLTPVFLSDMDIQAQVYHGDDLDTVLLESEHTFYDIAPSYDFKIRMFFEDVDLEVGDYVLKVSMSNDDYEFEFQEEFNLSEAE